MELVHHDDRIVGESKLNVIVRRLATGLVAASVYVVTLAVAEADLRQDSSTPLPLELAVVESALRENDKTSTPDTTAAHPAQSQYTPSAVQHSKPASPLKSPESSKQEPREVQQAEASPAPPAGLIHPAAPSSEPPSEPLPRIEAQWDAIVKLLRTRKGSQVGTASLDDFWQKDMMGNRQGIQSSHCEFIHVRFDEDIP